MSGNLAEDLKKNENSQAVNIQIDEGKLKIF